MNFFRSGTALSLLLWTGLTACSDETGARTIDVSVQASPMSSSLEFGETGPYVACDLLLSATAVGSNGMKATWQSGRIEVLAGRLRNVSEGYITLTEDELRAIWSNSDIGAGAEAQARLLVRHGAPFNGRGTFRYLADGASSSDTARFNFRCDADGFEPNGTAWVSIAQLIDPPATINPGDPLTVRFHAGGDAGIIQSEVQVASEHVTVMNRWPERDGPVRSTYRTALIPVTNDHPLGSQIRIRVVATTRMGFQGASEWLVGPTVVDIAHPQIYNYCLTAGIGDMCNIYPAILPFLMGDTLRINVKARDNYGLEHLVWRVDGFAADSIAIREDEETEIAIPVQSGWANARSITFYVIDKAGLHSPMISHGIRMVAAALPPDTNSAAPGGFDRASR